MKERTLGQMGTVFAMQARLSYYQDYAEHLASFGFILVQYENPPLRIIPDKYEVRQGT